MSRFIYCYAECHYAECHYAECHYAECCYAECHSALSGMVVKLVFFHRQASSVRKVESQTKHRGRFVQHLSRTQCDQIYSISCHKCGHTLLTHKSGLKENSTVEPGS
jgi:hypothetical protein